MTTFNYNAVLSWKYDGKNNSKLLQYNTEEELINAIRTHLAGGSYWADIEVKIVDIKAVYSVKKDWNFTLESGQKSLAVQPPSQSLDI